MWASTPTPHLVEGWYACMSHVYLAMRMLKVGLAIFTLCVLVQISNYTTSIRVKSSKSIHYKNTSTEDFLLWNFNYSATGQLDIAVTFSSDTCEKSSVVQYLGKVLMRCIS